jgi:hypothetical protein
MRALAFALVAALAACDANLTPVEDPPPPVAGCVPDRDGVITAAELPVATDVAPDFYVGTDVTVDLAGDDAGGERRWDLSVERADDDIVALGAAPLADQWYAGSFPAGRFVVAAGAGLDAIYSKDDAALWLHGTASTEMNPAAGRTLVVYTTPVPILRLPLADGDRVMITAPLPAATIAGLPFVGEDRYDIEVAGAGRLDLPYLRFSPVLRVRTHVVRAASSGGAMTSRRAVSFVFECFGEIARADSRADEPAADFTVAAALRRFALP